MTHDQGAQREAHAEHQEMVLVLRMVWVKEAGGILVEKDRLGFLERDLVLAVVRISVHVPDAHIPWVKPAYGYCGSPQGCKNKECKSCLGQQRTFRTCVRSKVKWG